MKPSPSSTAVTWGSTRAGCCRPTRYKYVYNTNDIDELYDHAKDPHELRNLAGDPAHDQVLADMRHCMIEWMKRTEDDLYNEWTVYWLTGDRELAGWAPGRSNKMME